MIRLTDRGIGDPITPEEHWVTLTDLRTGLTVTTEGQTADAAEALAARLLEEQTVIEDDPNDKQTLI